MGERTFAPHPQVEAAKLLYKHRRLRARHFAGSLFAEPTWDMLLDMFIADCERRKVSVKSVCIGADVPTTTALRHSRWLEERGLVERLNHPRDARSMNVRLSEKALKAMEAYLGEIAGSAPSHAPQGAERLTDDVIALVGAIALGGRIGVVAGHDP